MPAWRRPGGAGGAGNRPPDAAREVPGNRPAGRETTRHAAGHYEKCLNWANVLEQPPASLRGGCSGSPATLAQSAEVGVESL